MITRLLMCAFLVVSTQIAVPVFTGMAELAVTIYTYDRTHVRNLRDRYSCTGYTRYNGYIQLYSNTVIVIHCKVVLVLRIVDYGPVGMDPCPVSG